MCLPSPCCLFIRLTTIPKEGEETLPKEAPQLTRLDLSHNQLADASWRVFDAGAGSLKLLDLR